jgi:hypothetical protein
MTSRGGRVVLAALVVGLGAAIAAAPGGATKHARASSLALNAVLEMTSTPTSCPPEAPPDATLCAVRVGEGLVPGLGRVSENYMFYVAEQACGQAHRVLETTLQLEVAGKGAFQLAAARAQDCVPSALDASRPFTITGGTGIYAGATGGGTVYHQAHYTFSGSAGTDTWTGTLSVSGLEFDTTPPTLAGATNRTVRARRGAKRLRVTFKVTATDQVDGPVAVTCKPRSGSRFRIGRTKVTCASTDSSANLRTARFGITVKPRR